MPKRPALDIQDEIMRSHIEDIQAGFQENVVLLEAVPTADEPLLEDNEVGAYGGLYYRRTGDTIYVITPSSSITVS